MLMNSRVRTTFTQCHSLNVRLSGTPGTSNLTIHRVQFIDSSIHLNLNLLAVTASEGLNRALKLETVG